jgi:adenylosuccinate synthase
MKKQGLFHCIVDSAWGSSGKAAASCRIAEIRGIKNVSSGNFPNAGHTFVNDDGYTFVGKALPTPLILSKRGKLLTGWVGPNSGFDLAQLEKEIHETGAVLGQTLHIHDRAAITEQIHRDAEGPGGSLSTLAISSTMSGAGATYALKAMRQPTTLYAGEMLDEGIMQPWNFYEAVQRRLDEADQSFLHEVSQGFALSLDYGTHARTCTFRNCTSQQAYADFGIKPRQIGDVYLNLRTFPIRVGNNYDDKGNMVGYSGDGMDDSFETDWVTVATEAGFPADEIHALAEKERTTVTKKIRRVFTHSMKLTQMSARINNATKLVLNFVHYLDWNDLDKTGEGPEAFAALSQKTQDFVRQLESATGLKVVMIGTGAKHSSYVLPYGREAV